MVLIAATSNSAYMNYVGEMPNKSFPKGGIYKNNYSTTTAFYCLLINKLSNDFYKSV